MTIGKQIELLWFRAEIVCNTQIELQPIPDEMSTENSSIYVERESPLQLVVFTMMMMTTIDCRLVGV